MNTQLAVALIGFGTAVVGLVTAAIGRRKEITHRHQFGEAMSGGPSSSSGRLGIILAGVGFIVAMAAMIVLA